MILLILDITGWVAVKDSPDIVKTKLGEPYDFEWKQIGLSYLSKGFIEECAVSMSPLG